MIFTTVNLTEEHPDGYKKILPIKWIDGGDTLRISPRYFGPKDNPDEVERFKSCFQGKTYEMHRKDHVFQIISREVPEWSLLIATECNKDIEILMRLFPDDVPYNLSVTLNVASTPPAAEIISKVVDRHSARTQYQQRDETLPELRERATMLNMPGAEKASMDRIRVWLGYRGKAVSAGATPMGAVETANAQMEQLDTKGKREPVTA